MSRFENVDTTTLLIDYRANVEFLRDNPGRMAKETNRQRLQELIARDVDPEEFKVDTVRRRLYAPKGYVIVNWPRQAGDSGARRSRHLPDNHALRVEVDRPATDEELASLEVCHWCMNDSGVSGLGSEPLVEPQGDSVRTVGRRVRDGPAPPLARDNRLPVHTRSRTPLHPSSGRGSGVECDNQRRDRNGCARVTR